MVEQDIEKLKIYFFDSFLSTEQFAESYEVNGYSVKKPTEIALSSGIGDGGSARLNYNRTAFNPHYSEMTLKLRLNSKSNVKAFWGLKANLTEPASVMTESHVGLYLEGGKLYFTTADGNTQQRVQIQGIDITKWYEFRIVNYSLWIKPLPQIITYLGLPFVVEDERKWFLAQANTTYPPDDIVHNIMFFVKSTTNSERFLYLNKVVYKEEYPD